ncbi:hypothetical protein Mapa_006232 [Marchantia paleacea]|nr:hypothetical protein Mapa_006232 [Marchantia paleacea]
MAMMGRLAVLSVAVVVALSLATTVAAARVELEQFAPSVNFGANLSSLEQQLPLEAGLVWGYYSKSCPKAESIVTQKVSEAIRKDPGIAPGLLRIFFHDCFVKGCDASILLRNSRGSELNDIPNRTIRQSALNLIDQIKTALEQACKGVVSCADIVVLAGRDSVKLAGGPAFNVPLGRLDSFTIFPTNALPTPFASFNDQLNGFKAVGLNTQDLVALASGGHTLGISQCASFQARIFPNLDPKLNKDFGNALRQMCGSSSNTVGIDFFTPNKFDNQIYKNFLSGGALLLSDQNMDTDSTAWNLVKTWANNQGAFFNQFQTSFIKMSQINTLSGRAGEVRRVCTKPNNMAQEFEPEIKLVTDV